MLRILILHENGSDPYPTWLQLLSFPSWIQGWEILDPDPVPDPDGNFLLLIRSESATLGLMIDEKINVGKKKCCGSMTFCVDPDPDPRIHASD